MSMIGGIVFGTLLLVGVVNGYAPPRNFAEFVAWVVGLAALVTATLYLLGRVRLAFRWVEQIHDLTTRELEHTGNPDDDSTMKDDLHGIAVSLGRLQRRVDAAATAIARNSDRLDDVESDLQAIYDPMHRWNCHGDHKPDPPDSPTHREDI